MVATTNANESRAKDNFFGMKNRTDYRNGKPKDNTFRNKENSFKPKEENPKQYSGFGNKDKSYTQRSRNNFSYHNSMDKDEDSDTKNIRGRKTAVNKSKSSQNKDLEQPDKLETIKRLEREKKVVQKKNREEEIEKPKRPVVKQKRNTKDWTKDYEYGLLNEEEVF